MKSNEMIMVQELEVAVKLTPDEIAQYVKQTIPVQRHENTEEELSFSLEQFSLTGQSQQLREKMLDDKFILGNFAILGQSTIFYAQPNAGKTLLTIWLLQEAIKRGDIVGKDVFYINADDNYKGLVTKLEIAEKLGFNMLAPEHKGFKAKNFATYIQQTISGDGARGKVIILDTAKKFVDLMHKTQSSEFGKIIREFVLQRVLITSIFYGGFKPSFLFSPHP